MDLKKLSLLGVRFSNLNSQEIIQSILSKKKGEHCRYIATVNCNYLSLALGFGDEPANQQLLETLRNSWIVTCDGMPIVFLFRLLGFPLQRIAGADLVPEIAKAFTNHGKSIFLLGGEENINKLAEEKLKNLGVKITGALTPNISIQGPSLKDAPDQDAAILEAINQASPDLLIIALGCPKQEIWFNRIKNNLQVPISIGVGGTLKFLSKKVRRAPKWMQSLGLEWAFRIKEEPSLIFRYFFDGIKIFFFYSNLISSHYLTSIFKNKKQKDLLFLSKKGSIASLTISDDLDVENALLHDQIILNFENVFHLTPVLMEKIIKLKTNSTSILFYGINFWIKWQFKAYKFWDLLKPNVCQTAQELVDRINHEDYFDAIDTDGERVIIHFFGRLTQSIDLENKLNQLEPMLHLPSLMLDFSFCSFIDNKGFSFLLQLKQLVESKQIKLAIKKLKPSLKKQFKLSGSYSLFEQVP